MLISPDIPSCRPEGSRTDLSSGEIERLGAASAAANRIWVSQIRALTGKRPDSIYSVLQRAGVAGLVQSAWSGGWGTTRIVGPGTEMLSTLAMACEDYGLIYRLARHGSAPILRVDGTAERSGNVPAANVLATLPGTERPEEYVMLSAHLDSWDGGSGATDNGSGTLIMLEAMRILRAAYPHPRRTIVAGHWDGEETGLNGSLAFAEDHPEILRGMQVLLNQDNGTGGIAAASLQGFTAIGPTVRRWVNALSSSVPSAMALDDPGLPGGGTDYASFTCRGVPAIALESRGADYNPYTWHTRIDTYDKLSMDDLRRNATIVAMLAYLAAEEAELVPRDRASISAPVGGVRQAPMTCAKADRTGANRNR